MRTLRQCSASILSIAIAAGLLSCGRGSPSEQLTSPTTSETDRKLQIIAESKFSRSELAPTEVAAAASFGVIYVAMVCPGPCRGEGVWILDASNLTVIHKASVSSGCSRRQLAPGMAVNPSSGELYLIHCIGRRATIIYPDGRRDTMSIPFRSPFPLIGADDVMYLAADDIASLQIPSGKVIRTRSLPLGPVGTPLWTGGSVLLPTLDGVSIIDGRSLESKRLIKMGLREALCLALTPEGFVARDAYSAVAETVALPSEPPERMRMDGSVACSLEVDESRGVAYTFGRAGTFLIGFDTETFEEVVRLRGRGSDHPSAMDLDPHSGTVFVNLGSSIIAVALTQ